jgi:hypothetical protein
MRLLLLFGGEGLMIGSLIAISLTSGMLAINVILLAVSKRQWFPLEPTFIALGVEVLILVISVVMYWFAIAGAWDPY